MCLDDAWRLRRDFASCSITMNKRARSPPRARGAAELVAFAVRDDGTRRYEHDHRSARAWHDSVPGLCVSGQVRRDTTVAGTSLPLRQLGDQEADIVRLVASITKYAATDRGSPAVAVSGREGPVAGPTGGRVRSG